MKTEREKERKKRMIIQASTSLLRAPTSLTPIEQQFVIDVAYISAPLVLYIFPPVHQMKMNRVHPVMS
jgi:hypothetical protein